MRIITSGNSWKKERCPHCECVFEYQDKEIKTKILPSYNFSPYGDWFNYVECPECRRKIEV